MSLQALPKDVVRYLFDAFLDRSSRHALAATCHSYHRLLGSRKRVLFVLFASRLTVERNRLWRKVSVVLIALLCAQNGGCGVFRIECWLEWECGSH